MKQDLVECEAELAELDRQLRTLPQPSAAIAQAGGGGDERGG